MIALPAIDLREGACVQLVGGAYEAEKIRLSPLDALGRWRAFGFKAFHVVDLDAALGKGDNRDVIATLLRTPGCTFSVGGGVRSEEKILELVDLGAKRVVVGTRALEEPGWLAEMAELFPDKLVVAADVRRREVVTRGWQQGLGRDVETVLASLAKLPLAGVLVTAVHVEGQQQGPDLPLMEEVARAVPGRLYASGGITTLEDLRALRKAGAMGAVIGMALYTGRLDAQAVAKEFA